MTDYLKELFGTCDGGMLTVWDKSTKRTEWFRVDQLDEASAFMIEKANTTDIYFGWGLQENKTNGRGKAETVYAVPGFMFDVDIQSSDESVHSKNHLLPKGWEEVAEFVSELGIPEPTAIRHSGNGAYFDWLFEKASVLDGASRKRVSEISKLLHHIIIAEAKRLKGWHFDNTSDLSRVTRVPGTKNHKTSPPKDVSLLRFKLEKRYSFESFAADLQSVADKLEIHASQSEQKAPLTRPPSKRGGVHQDTMCFEAVAEGCAWVGDLVANAERISEPNWYALATIVGRCESGQAIFHQISQRDERYNSDETQKKLDQVSPGPRTCGNIATESAPDICNRCSLRMQLKTPLSLGQLSPSIARLMRTHIFDIATGRYVDLQTRQSFDERTFSNKFRHLTGDKTPHGILIAHRFTRKVDRCDYLPGTEQLFVANEERQDVLNLWEPSGLKPIEGSSELITSHLEYLYPNPIERDHVLNCIAHAVQKPSKKLRHVLLTIGKQGTGKSFVGAVLTKIFGAANIWIAESSDLHSDWTAQMGNRQLLIMEELGIFERRETYETLKRWISEETVTVNEKHVKKYIARTPKVIIAFSNHKVPTAMQEGDRRWWVSHSPAEPKSQEYYSRLFSEGLTEVPAFLYQLMKRNLKDFDASATPPMTAAKAEILSLSRPALEQEISAMMEDEIYPFVHDLFSLQHVRSALNIRQNGRLAGIKDVSAAIRSLGALPIPQQRLAGNQRVRPWVWRNHDYWLTAESSAVRAFMGRTLTIEDCRHLN